MQPERPQQAIASLDAFLTTPLDALVRAPMPGTIGEPPVALSRRVAATVPAYRAFLHEHAVDPASLQTADDFRRLPLMTKENYLCRYPLADLCRGGWLTNCDMVAVSSGFDRTADLLAALYDGRAADRAALRAGVS